MFGGRWRCGCVDATSELAVASVGSAELVQRLLHSYLKFVPANLAESSGTGIATSISMINPDRLTVKSAEALNEAVSAARQAGNPVVYDLHLLLALLGQDEGIVVPVLQKLGVSVAALRERAQAESARYPKQSDAQPNLSRELTQIFDRAEKEAKDLGDEYVSTEHLLLALAEVKGAESKI